MLASWHTNGGFPQTWDSTRKSCRVSGIRCGHTTSWDGEYMVFYGENEQVFYDGYSNLLRNIQPIMTYGA